MLPASLRLIFAIAEYNCRTILDGNYTDGGEQERVHSTSIAAEGKGSDYSNQYRKGRNSNKEEEEKREGRQEREAKETYVERV